MRRDESLIARLGEVYEAFFCLAHEGEEGEEERREKGKGKGRGREEKVGPLSR